MGAEEQPWSRRGTPELLRGFRFKGGKGRNSPGQTLNRPETWSKPNAPAQEPRVGAVPSPGQAGVWLFPVLCTPGQGGPRAEQLQDCVWTGWQ